MAWTAPRTWVTSEVVTASVMNTHVRDNFLETAPAKASSAGGYIVPNGANSITARLAVTDTVSTSQTTASTSYVDLATAGPTLTTLSTGVTAFVLWSCFMQNNTANEETKVSVAVSGASSVSASDNIALRVDHAANNNYARVTGHNLFTSLTSGGNTFQLKYAVSGGTGTFANRTITAWSLS